MQNQLEKKARPFLARGTAAVSGAVLAAAVAMPGTVHATGATGAAAMQGSSNLIDGEGRTVGTVHWAERDGGGVELTLQASGLTPGPHAVHLHETGACDTPDFKSAGGHFNPAGAPHGEMDQDADPKDPDHHAGDMPNQTVAEDGTLKVTINNRSVSLVDGPNTLLDEDGSALVIHAGVDDYTSQPAGDAGARIACAVINKTAS